MPTKRIQPAGLFQRSNKGRALYSHVVVAAAQELIFISGQVSRDKNGNVVGAGDMRAQIRQVGENLRIALEEVGAGLDALVKTTTFVTDIEEFFRHVDARQDYLDVGLPTSTTIEVKRLSHPDFMIEIDAIALLPSSSQ